MHLGDKAAILYGYKELRKVFADPALTPVLVKEIYPGANVTSDADLWHAISGGSLTFHHPVGLLSFSGPIFFNRVMKLTWVLFFFLRLVPSHSGQW